MMRNKWLGFVLIFLTMLIFSGCEIENREITIPVMIADVDGIKVLSENPVSIPIGEDAVFSVELEEGVIIDNLPEGIVYENGKITITDVFFPKTLKLITHRRMPCEFVAEVSLAGGGRVEASHEKGTYWSETEVALTAIPEEGYYFTGYSLNEPVEQGGEIISLEASYRFTLMGNTKLYANFSKVWIDPAITVDVPKDKWVIIYHPNGGVRSDTGMDDTKMVEFSNTYYLCPNTIQDWDYFERDGYLLYGYNTKADGSGTYYGPGWNILMPERGAISLYCMWAKISEPSDFEYYVDNNTAVITKYKGNDEFVVIPETLDGYQVKTIKSKAFDNNESMKKVFINKSIRTISEKAFESCSSLEELYFSDSVTSVKDSSFSNCESLHKLYMLAVVTPQYGTQRNGTYAIKYERLITAPGKKLVIASGSSCAYGIDSALLEQNLKNAGYEYSVVNYGQNASTALTFYTEVIASHLNEGDILMLAPEIDRYQFGYSKINETLWQIFEGAYDAFSCVDIRKYSNLFSSFSSFNSARNQTNQNLSAYEKYTKQTVNSYGDYSMKKTGYTSSYENKVKALLNNGGVGDWDYTTCVSLMKQYSDKLNRTLDMAAEKGGKVLISFAATNRIAMNASSQEDGGEVQTAYENAIDKYLHGTRISNVSTYTMDTELFYNSHNHLGTEGAKVRTESISKDILEYLKSAE